MKTTLGTEARNPPAKKRLVIADAAALCGMLRDVIAKEPECEIVGEAGTGPEALQMCRKLAPDVLILELVLPGMGGAELIDELRRHGLPTRALVFTNTRHHELLRAALKACPHGFVHKEETIASFQIALRSVLRGETHHCALASELARVPGKSTPETELRPRDRTVLKMIAEEMPSKAIAGKLGLSPKSIDHDRTRLMKMFCVHTVAGLTRVAMRMGLVE